MDPLSIAANIITVAVVCGKLVQNIGRFVNETKGGPDNIATFYDTIRNLQLALQNIGHVLGQRPRQLPFEKDHHHNIYQIVLSCRVALDRLDRQLPEMKETTGPLDKIRLSIAMSLRKTTVQQTTAHITSYTQVLQLSLITLSLGSIWGTQRSQDQIQAEIRNLTDSIRSANLLTPKPDAGPDGEMEERVADANLAVTKEIQAWRLSADDVAAAVSLYEPDQVSLDARSFDQAVPSDSGIDMGTEAEEDDFDPEPDHEDYPSQEVLQCQFEQNQKIVKQLVRCGIFLKASSYQRKGIDWRDQLSRHHKVPFPHDEQADMKEYLAEMLLGSETTESTAEAKGILETLLKDEVGRGAEQMDQSRRCRLYSKLGKLYMDQGNIRQARRSLSRAFEGRKKMDPMPKDLVMESLDLLVKALQLDQAYDEARGYMAWKQRELLPSAAPQPADITSSTGVTGLSNAFAWCQEKGFDVDAHDFCFDVCDSIRGTSPLHLAAQEENLEVFRQIVDHVVSFEHRDAEFATPLLLACGTRNRETTRMLLEHGAKVDVRDKFGMSPLHRCQSKSGGVQVAKELLKRYPAAPSLSACTARPDLINVPDVNGKTALFMAVEKGNLKMAQFLLEQGASPDLTESYGKTALYVACEKGDERMVRCVLEHQASPNIPGPGLCTPLVATIETTLPISVKIPLVRLLLAHGADPRIADADGQTSFTAANRAGFGSEIRRLLQQVDLRRLSTVSTLTTATTASRASGSSSSTTQSSSLFSKP